MKFIPALTIATLVGASPVYASCDFTKGPCYTDNNRNTYMTQPNLGGGYTTNRNGQQFGTTNQNFGGGWQQQNNNGQTKNYNYDPYKPKSRGW